MTSYARLAFADASFEHGLVADAREAVYAVLRSGVNSPMVRIALATAGIPIALATGDDGLLARCDLRETIEVAARLGRVGAVRPAGRGVRPTLSRRRRLPEAQQLLRRALDMMTDLWSNLPTLSARRAHLPARRHRTRAPDPRRIAGGAAARSRPRIRRTVRSLRVPRRR